MACEYCWNGTDWDEDNCVNNCEKELDEE